ncbi:(d)CMP kinase [Ichthyenterobacterium sp. W332]|uniref:Cytidylate kinase n=1 Tax=Microcosmobacter mediterraneus TaxID=3075607 RepID=A0ABU2YHN8_9FLAO|nr:(d)CMP kinase [Ichthyenterobacterium sp. W332]MDT0557656.1 (d)CMP kinase [Ichthyenterobacterium sp. W332]
MTNITIAIDGFSSTGKSTVAKLLAKALGYIYVDSGAMYRAVTFYAMQHNFIEENYLFEEALVKSLDDIFISFKHNEELGFSEVFLNNVNIEKEIRTLEVSNFVSTIAAIPEVRRKLVIQQQDMGKAKGVVMDGRDIGTVVFPYAELKIFMTASAETRAQRRFQELIDRGDEVHFEEVLDNVIKRDYIDSTREDSPLIQAEDAVLFNNSNFSIEEQFEKVLNLAKSIIKHKKSDTN